MCEKEVSPLEKDFQVDIYMEKKLLVKYTFVNNI